MVPSAKPSCSLYFTINFAISGGGVVSTVLEVFEGRGFLKMMRMEGFLPPNKHLRYLRNRLETREGENRGCVQGVGRVSDTPVTRTSVKIAHEYPIYSNHG